MSLLDDRFQIEHAEYYVDKMFGDRKGYVSVVFGHNPKLSKPRFEEDDFRPKYYDWPAQRDDLIEDVDDALNHNDVKHENIEIFICPALRKVPSRRQGTHAPLLWVWADMDHRPTESQLDRIRGLGAMTVLSGSEGHRHVYLELDKPVSATAHKALCLALKDAVGAKDSKIAENDLLRLPGTLNWKTADPKQVFLKSTGRRARSAAYWVKQLTSMTGRDWSYYADHAKATTPRDLGVVKDVPRPKLKGESLKAYRYNPDNDGQRHDAIYKLVRTMKEEGYTRDQTHATLHTYAPALSKWNTDWRISNDVDRIWQKAKIADRPTVAQTIAADDDGLEQPELQFHHWQTVVHRVRTSPPPRYLFQGVWVEGDYGVVYAMDKAGKSWAMLDAAISCASGTAWMDKWECNAAGPVIICFGEGSERKQIRRADAIARSKGLTDEQFQALPIVPLFSVPTIADDVHLAELEAKIAEVRPALVIIDPFYLAASGADSANLNAMGVLLRRIQLVCQRHNAALMISHHWNKTGNGDAHSRASGTGLTAWGRVLISIELPNGDGLTDAITKRSSVMMRWHIKGDEVSSEQAEFTREVWEDSPGDLSCQMNYLIIQNTAESVDKMQPIKNAPTLQRISDMLSENAGGLGVRQLLRTSKETGRPIGQKTLMTSLDLLELHGFIQVKESTGQGMPKKHILVRPFTRDLLDPLGRLKNNTGEASTPQITMPRPRSSGSFKPATRVVIDMSRT